MKKIRYKNIKIQIWINFLVLILIVGFLVWFLQVFMINNFYEDMKIASNKAAVSELIETYGNNSQKDFSEFAYNLSSGDDIFIKVEHGEKVIFSSSNQVEKYSKELNQAEKRLDEDRSSDSVTLILEEKNTDRQTWVYAGYIDETKEKTLFVVSPLYPVSSTIQILKQQLIYIALLSFAVAALFAFITSKRISQPIERISSQANRLAIGNYGVEFDENYRYEEIRNLSKTLNRASVEIDKSLELQKDLLANISHDLKTPLTMIKSYAEMIRDLSGDIPQKRNNHLQVIIDESDRLNNLVNDILILSSAQAGTLNLDIAAFSIEGLFKSVIQTYDILRERAGFNIMFNCRQDVMVLGDESRIKQVASNLLTNAIKYGGEDKMIFVNVKKWGKRVHCEIVDHGKGIKADELPYIWERYYKSSTNHVRKAKGSGIGLSIVKEILSAHNARFGVESKVDKGTTFWFELEVAPSNLSEIPKKPSQKNN